MNKYKEHSLENDPSEDLKKFMPETTGVAAGFLVFNQETNKLVCVLEKGKFYSFPCGKVKDEDNDLLETAKRELKEEANLEIIDDNLCEIVIKNEKINSTQLVTFFKTTTSNTKPVKSDRVDDDIIESREFSEDEVSELIRTGAFKKKDGIIFQKYRKQIFPDSSSQKETHKESVIVVIGSDEDTGEKNFLFNEIAGNTFLPRGEGDLNNILKNSFYKIKDDSKVINHQSPNGVNVFSINIDDLDIHIPKNYNRDISVRSINIEEINSANISEDDRKILKLFLR